MPSLRGTRSDRCPHDAAERRPAREFGDVDIYLFDQLHRGRIVEGMKVLDAGCGGGRNLVDLLRRGFDIWGTDWTIAPWPRYAHRRRRSRPPFQLIASVRNRWNG